MLIHSQEVTMLIHSCKQLLNQAVVVFGASCLKAGRQMYLDLSSTLSKGGSIMGSYEDGDGLCCLCLKLSAEPTSQRCKLVFAFETTLLYKARHASPASCALKPANHSATRSAWRAALVFGDCTRTANATTRRMDDMCAATT